MTQRFLDYIKDEYSFSEEEMSDFINSYTKPLKKSIRINTNKISIKNFQKKASENNWTLTQAKVGKNVFYIDRLDTSIPLGNTLEHIAGLFYIQEVSASSAPYFLANDSVDTGEYLILDMSASPGGKTTQLAEYYPNSFIIANEIDKNRLKGLFTNIERMSAYNVSVTNYDGRFFSHYPEKFDKILLDAPCSGEGTCFKGTDAVKYWNIKNIKRIAKLQHSLLESALISLKVGGEILFSTCTLNRLENEGVVEKLVKKYGDYFEINIISGTHNFKRFWPHIDHTGGFFAVKITKLKTVDIWQQKPNNIKPIRPIIEKLTKKEESLIIKLLEENFSFDISPYYLYKHRNRIFLSNKNYKSIIKDFFYFRIGIEIGKFEEGIFMPDFKLGTILNFDKNILELDEDGINNYLKGENLFATPDLKDGLYAIKPDNIALGVVTIKDGIIKNLLANKTIRK